VPSRRRSGDALSLACQAWLSSPHGGHGTLYLRLCPWYGRIVAEVERWEGAPTAPGEQEEST